MATLSDVSWITDHWQGEMFGGIGEEIWSQSSGNSMTGVFKLIKQEKKEASKEKFILSRIK